MNYTKGEWRTVKDAQGINMIMHPTEEGYALASLTDTFNPVHGFWYEKDWDWDKIAERESNAHLISAAPDMYEALKELLHAYRVVRPQIFGTDEHEETASEALAKAEGK